MQQGLKHRLKGRLARLLCLEEGERSDAERFQLFSVRCQNPRDFIPLH